MNAVIPIGGTIDLIFSAVSAKTGLPVVNVKITEQSVMVSDGSVVNYVQDGVDGNVWHFTGVKMGTVEIECSARIGG